MKYCSVDYIVNLARWPLLVLVEHCPYIRDIQMETAIEAPGQPEAVVSDLSGPRLLGYLVLQFIVPVHGKGKWSELHGQLTFPFQCCSQCGPIWATLLTAASWLIALCAHTYLSQLSVSSCTPLIYLTGTELSSLLWFSAVSPFFIHHPRAYCLAPCFCWYHRLPPRSVLCIAEIIHVQTACSVYRQSLHVNKNTFTAFW